MTNVASNESPEILWYSTWKFKEYMGEWQEISHLGNKINLQRKPLTLFLGLPLPGHISLMAICKVTACAEVPFVLFLWLFTLLLFFNETKSWVALFILHINFTFSSSNGKKIAYSPLFASNTLLPHCWSGQQTVWCQHIAWINHFHWYKHTTLWWAQF